MLKKLRFIINHSFIKFAAVGFAGTAINLLLFYIFVDILGFRKNVTATCVFLFVGTQNYLLHHSWSFRENTDKENLSLKGWVKFTVTTLFGFGVSLIVLNLIDYVFNPPNKVIAQFCGVAFGTLFNYLGSKHLVFNSAAAEKSLG